MRHHRLLAPALLILTSVLWSLGGVLIKAVNWHPMAIAGARSAIAVPVMMLCLGWPRFTFSRTQIGGALAYAATVVLFVLATRLTTAANAIFLQYTAPIYVAALGHWWLGEKALRIDWLVILIALSGIALFFLDQLSASGLLGNLVALGSGISFAALALMLRREKAGSPASAIVLGNMLTAMVGLPFMLRAPSGQGDWLWIVLLGVVQLAVPYVLYSVAIKRVTALEATLLPLLEPVLNPLWVMLALGERPGPWALFGAALVLGAVLLRGALMVVHSQRDEPVT